MFNSSSIHVQFIFSSCAIHYWLISIHFQLFIDTSSLSVLWFPLVVLASAFLGLPWGLQEQTHKLRTSTGVQCMRFGPSSRVPFVWWENDLQVPTTTSPRVGERSGFWAQPTIAKDTLSIPSLHSFLSEEQKGPLQPDSCYSKSTARKRANWHPSSVVVQSTAC